MYSFLSKKYQKLKYYIRILQGKEVFYNADIHVKKVILGNYYGEWCIASDYVKKDGIIYSIGVGTDISFDLGLIDKFNCQVFAFDPTPRSIEWVSKQNLPAKFKFTEIGVSDTDGVIKFYPPADSGHVSFTSAISREGNYVELPVSRLLTIMQKFGHEKIDLLKMDIEGAEYAVIQDLLNSGIRVTQLLVEFHHRFDLSNLSKTRMVVAGLKEAGYKIFYVSPNGEEYSFIKPAK